jgi:aspartyl protease family protein
VIRAFKIKLDVVRAGPIELRNVDAVVMEGEQPDEVLLGMSFLDRLEIINEDNRLLLRRKY